MSSSNPFDFSQAFAKFDPKEMTKQFQDMFKFDMDALSEASNKNLDLLMTTNKAIAEGSQAMIQRQVEMMEAAISEATNAAKGMVSTTDPKEVAGKQAELLKSTYETALKNTMEISEMAKKTQEEIFEKMNARIAESMDELKSTISKIS